MNFERRKRRGKEFIFFDIVNAKIDDDKYCLLNIQWMLQFRFSR